MSVFFKLQCKALLVTVPALVLLVILQCVLGQIAAVALNNAKTDLVVAYCIEERSGYAKRFAEAIENSTVFKSISTDSLDDKTLLFETGRADAFVFIPKSFDDAITKGVHPAVTVYIAPGVTDYEIIKEYLGNQCLVFRSEALVSQVFAGRLRDSYHINSSLKSDTPIVLVEREGPLLQSGPYIVPPVYSIPALFLLLSFLHAAAFAVGSDNPRWRMRGARVLKQASLLSLLAVFCYWSVAILAYTVGMRFIYKLDVPLPVILSLFGITAFSISAGGLLAYYGKRHLSVWIFVPLLLLNMTVGGGLWNAVDTSIKFPLVLPITAVLTSATGTYKGAAVLFAQTMFFILLVLIDMRFKRPNAYLWKNNF